MIVPKKTATTFSHATYKKMSVDTTVQSADTLTATGARLLTIVTLPANSIKNN